jgi:hypothetical protein
MVSRIVLLCAGNEMASFNWIPMYADCSFSRMARGLGGRGRVLAATVAIPAVSTVARKRIEPEHTLGRSGSYASTLNHRDRPHPLPHFVIGQSRAPALCRQQPTLHNMTTTRMGGRDLVGLPCGEGSPPLEHDWVLESAALRRRHPLGCCCLRGCGLLGRRCRFGRCGRCDGRRRRIGRCRR